MADAKKMKIDYKKVTQKVIYEFGMKYLNDEERATLKAKCFKVDPETGKKTIDNKSAKVYMHANYSDKIDWVNAPKQISFVDAIENW